MLVLLLQAWLLQASSAEFLTPVLDHGNANLDLCQQETVVSCNLVKIDLDSLDASTVASWEPPWTSWTSLATTPTPSPLKMGLRRASPWTWILAQSGVTPNLPTAETSSSSRTWTTATGATWLLRRIRELSLTTWLRP